MTISSALNIISSAFQSTAAQSSVIASNISNVSTTGYVRKTANQITTDAGGSEVVSVTRQANVALLDQLNASTSESAAQSAISSGLATLAQTVNDSASTSSSSGALQNGSSPYALLGNLQFALSNYDASPSDSSAASAVVSAAQSLTSALKQGAATVTQVQETADQGMATAVTRINSLLAQFEQANTTVVSGLQSGSDVTTAEDTRDSILTQLSSEVGVTTTTNSNGSMSIYTDSGVTLFQDVPQTVAFTPTTTYVSGTSGNQVTVDGVPITGANSPMAVQSGALAGYSELRDQIAPQYEAQLDQIAGGLISAFQETDQTGGSAPALPGLFTAAGLSSVPSSSAATGLASEIKVNANVDPSQGGDLDLLRDGGISSPGSSTYTYNTTGAASYTGRISQMLSSLSTTQSFSASAGLPGSTDLMTYASDSVSWLQGQNQTASDASSYQSSLASQAGAALSNATGVNLDTEMTNMLNIENSYTSAAKLLTTLTTMFSALLNAA